MDVSHYEIKLKALQQDISERSERVDNHIKRRDGPLSADFEEQAIERENDDVVFALDDNLVVERRAVAAALERIEVGTFGTCTKCGREIEAARLDAIP